MNKIVLVVGPRKNILSLFSETAYNKKDIMLNHNQLTMKYSKTFYVGFSPPYNVSEVVGMVFNDVMYTHEYEGSPELEEFLSSRKRYGDMKSSVPLPKPLEITHAVTDDLVIPPMPPIDVHKVNKYTLAGLGISALVVAATIGGYVLGVSYIEAVSNVFQGGY